MRHALPHRPEDASPLEPQRCQVMSQLSSPSQKRGGPGTRYLVRSGDTLWDLAGQHLADPRRWPEIYEHNKDPRIVALTKSSIADPDLIFVGQQIYIPADTPAPPAVRSASHRSGGRRRAVREIQSFPFTYSLEQLPEITIVSPTHIATLKLTGSVTIQAGDLLNFATFRADGNIVSKMKREADLVFQKLVSDASVAYDPKTNSVKVAIGFTIHSKNGYTPSARLSASVSTKTGLPALKASILMPPPPPLNVVSYVMKVSCVTGLRHRACPDSPSFIGDNRASPEHHSGKGTRGEGRARRTSPLVPRPSPLVPSYA